MGVVHRTDASGQWQVEEIAPFDDSVGYGYPDIAVDTDGSMAIAYNKLVEGGLSGYYPSGTFVTTNSGQGWSSATLVEDYTDFPSVAMRDGTVHIVYATSLGGAYDIDCGPDLTLPLRYATVSGDATVSQTVSSNGASGLLDLAADGTPRIVFDTVCGSGDAPLAWYADGSSGTFALEPIPGLLERDNGADSRADMAIGVDGTVHVLFHRTLDAPTSVNYMALTSDGWSAPLELIPDGYRGVFAVDDRGGVHVVAFSGGDLLYATNRDSEFEVAPEPIAQVASNSYTDLAIDVDAVGRPHVVYSSDDPNSGVFYLVGPGW